MSVYVNPFISCTERVFPEQGRYAYKRYDMNENPEGLPSWFVSDVLKEVTPEFLSIYPEPGAFTAKYAAYLGVSPENLMTTNGSDMAIRYVFETFGRVGSKVVTVSPSFEMYRINCYLLGLKHCGVGYKDDLSLDVDSILQAIDDDTSIVVLLNPNNPIAGVYTEEQMDTIVHKAAEVGALVVIDEAYHYFYKKTFLSYINQYHHVLIFRTFSKCFSMAACRLGVIIGCPELIAQVTKSRLTFDVNAIALKFGERLMEHPEVIDELIATQDAGKAHLLEDLQAHGYECMDCYGNYVFILPHKAPKEVERLLKEQHRVLIKTFGHPALSRYIRVSTGSPAAMDTFLEAFYAVENS